RPLRQRLNPSMLKPMREMRLAVTPGERSAARREGGAAWEDAPAPEASDHIRLRSRYELFIGGKWQPPAEGRYFDTSSPSTEKKLAEIALAGEADVDRAVVAARTAHDKIWSR